LGAPAWAGIFADADTLRSSEGLGTLDGYSQTLPALYSVSSNDFNDITTGSNGTYSAGPGYDLVTGLGSPIGNLLVPDLANYGTSPAPEPSSMVLVFAAIAVAGGIRAASLSRKRRG
jgi:subtilase family serine protease